MPSYGDCEHYGYDMLGPAFGRCRMTPIGERAYKQVTYTVDASKCDMFTPLERVVTDTAQSAHMFDSHLRPYKDYEVENIDVNVNEDKVKDEKY